MPVKKAQSELSNYPGCVLIQSLEKTLAHFFVQSEQEIVDLLSYDTLGYP